MKWYEIVFGGAVWLLCLIIYGKVKDNYYGNNYRKRSKK